MAYLCISTIYIEGERHSLLAVADRINAGGGLKSDVFDSLGFEDDEEDFEYNHCNEVAVVEKGGRYYLQLDSCIEEWEDEEDWQTRVFPSGVYYELHSMDGNEEWDWTNDTEGEFFKEHNLALTVDGQTEELKGSFDTEAEAVQFIKDHSSGIPEDLVKLDDIADYCMKNHLRTLWYYGHTEVNNTCPPITAKVIECVLEATHIQ